MSFLIWSDTNALDLVWFQSDTDIVRYCITRFNDKNIRNSIDVYVANNRVAHIDSDEVQNLQRAKGYCQSDYNARLKGI